MLFKAPGLSFLSYVYLEKCFVGFVALTDYSADTVDTKVFC